MPIRSRLKTSALLIAASIAAPALFAQDIVGTWQGTIHTTKDFREVIQISKDGNNLKATLIGLDAQPGVIFDTQPGQIFPASSVSFQSKTVKMPFPGIGGTYQGTFSADGNSIAGSLLQNGATFTLNFVRATVQTAWEIPPAPSLAKPMASGSNPSFEVATVKPTPPGTQGGGLGPSPGGRFTVHNLPLIGLIGFAFGLNRNHIEGVPAWAETDRFDIVAKADTAGSPSMDQQKEMMQKLLADRFGLSAHREQREGTVYVLTVQSTGSKLTPTANPNGPAPASVTHPQGHSHLTAINLEMATFVTGLAGVVDRPVIDRTGLSDHFDVSLDWAPSEVQSQVPDTAAAFPDIFTALKDQLGLKLESTKGLVETLVIDRLERPTPN